MGSTIYGGLSGRASEFGVQRQRGGGLISSREHDIIHNLGWKELFEILHIFL